MCSRASTFSIARTGYWQFPGRPIDVEEPSRRESEKNKIGKFNITRHVTRDVEGVRASKNLIVTL